MKTPEMSVIIPAYNAQDTIIKCLDSIMRQDGINDFEVIVVNDGSTDNTGKIVQEYRYNRPNIQLANLMRNHGISVARNSGMRLARGRFITFVDADDMVGVSTDGIHPIINAHYAERENIGPMHIDAISYKNINEFVPPMTTTYFTNMLRVAKPDTDIVFGGKLGLDVRKNIMASYTYHDVCEFDLRPSDKDAALRNAYMRENANFALYNRDFLARHHLKFQPAMKLDEDILFCMQAVLRADTIIAVPDVMYLYIRHDNSASTPSDYWAAYDLSTIQHLSMFLNDLYNYPQYRDIFYHWLGEFKAIGQIAQTRPGRFPNAICGKCASRVNKCVACKRLRKLLASNIQHLVMNQKQK
ncbi:MAG: glycosyltransferase [Muribaculaceae bacterium]|nr:glycosyltransferase [Muribaculaceae bacterium]